jgi:hypothetical protein
VRRLRALQSRSSVNQYISISLPSVNELVCRIVTGSGGGSRECCEVVGRLWGALSGPCFSSRSRPAIARGRRAAGQCGLPRRGRWFDFDAAIEFDSACHEVDAALQAARALWAPRGLCRYAGAGALRERVPRGAVVSWGGRACTAVLHECICHLSEDGSGCVRSVRAPATLYVLRCL